MAHLTRIVRYAAPLAAAAAFAAPSAANAITLGTTEPVTPTHFPALRCDQPIWGTSHLYYQSVTLPGLTSAQAPTSGMISSWRTEQFGAADPGGTIALVVVRPTKDGVRIMAKDVQTIPATVPKGDIVFTPATPVPIAAGDYIGLWGPDEHSGCEFSGGKSTESVTRAAVGPNFTIGAIFPTITQAFGRVDVAAEMGAGPLPPGYEPVDGSGGGDTGGGPATGPGPGPGPTTPIPPKFGLDGKPLVGGSGKNVTVDTGQNVGCTEAGPCTVITTAAVWFGTGGSPANAAKAKAKKKAGKKKPTRKLVVVGTRRFTIPAGKTADVTFTLNRKGRTALVKAGKLRVEITTTVRQGTAAPITAKRTITIKPPKPPKKKHKH